MVVAEANQPRLCRTLSGIWRLNGWDARGIWTGIVDRRTDPSTLRSHLPQGIRSVQAEQVHGGSVALVDRSLDFPTPIAGCDALLTRLGGTALLIRSADCLPLFVSDPIRRAIGIAHVGWRGCAAALPMRLVGAFRRAFNSRPTELRVAFGPAMRACCYDVSATFAQWCGESFVRFRNGRRTFDLVGLVRHQLLASGVTSAHIMDSGICTAHHTDLWYSVRREGDATGRIISSITLCL